MSYSNRSMPIVLIAALAALATLVGCERAPNTGQGLVAITFVRSTVEQAVVIDEGADSINFSRLELRFSDLTLTAPSPDPERPNKAITAQQLDEEVNVLGSLENNVLIDADPALYTTLELGVAELEVGQGIDGTDAAIWVEGQREGLPFRFASPAIERIVLPDLDLDLEEGVVESVTLDLVAESWFDGVRWDRLRLEADGTALISRRDNPQAYAQIRNNMRQAWRAHVRRR